MVTGEETDLQPWAKQDLKALLFHSLSHFLFAACAFSWMLFLWVHKFPIISPVPPLTTYTLSSVIFLKWSSSLFRTIWKLASVRRYTFISLSVMLSLDEHRQTGWIVPHRRPCSEFFEPACKTDLKYLSSSSSLSWLTIPTFHFKIQFKFTFLPALGLYHNSTSFPPLSSRNRLTSVLQWP